MVFVGMHAARANPASLCPALSQAFWTEPATAHSFSRANG